MLTLNSPEVVQETALRWKRDHKIAFVPTMGCLHEGHLKLVRKAKEVGQKTIVSIFVNPLQFGPNEDFNKYPRPFEEDKAKLEEMDVDLLFHPSVEDLYGSGFATRVVVDKVSQSMEGTFRPGHFEGVATVCLKLFQITQADIAIFGEKDFQQLRVLQKLSNDLNLPLTILPHPTVRESDGLALSSRNRYLNEQERKAAAALPSTLEGVRAGAILHPEWTVGDLLGPARATLERAGFKIDYLEIASSRDLAPASPGTRLVEVPDARVFAAAKLGTTRLIDNWRLSEEGS